MHIVVVDIQDVYDTKGFIESYGRDIKRFNRDDSLGTSGYPYLFVVLSVVLGVYYLPVQICPSIALMVNVWFLNICDFYVFVLECFE